MAKNKKIQVNKSNFKKHLPKFLLGLAALLVVLVLAVFTLGIADDESDDANHDYVSAEIDETPNETIAPKPQDPDLLNLLKELGATHLDKLQINYVDSYKGTGDTYGEYEEVYINDDESQGVDYGILTVLKGLEYEELKRTAAHEYLHHIWFAVLTDSERSELTNQLNAMYANDEYMKEYEEDYKTDGGMTPTELFSFYCTESSDANLAKYVLDMCNKFIYRSKLTMLN